MALLELKNVNVRYIMKDKKVHACQHVSLEIEEQDSIGIVGESGSGKSTLASAVLRRCRADHAGRRRDSVQRQGSVKVNEG